MPPSLVLVTEPEFNRASAVFTSESRLRCVAAPAPEAEFARAVIDSGARHVVIGHLKYESALYRAMNRGSVMARFGVGHDGVDKSLGTAAGLLCTNTPGVLDHSVAEQAMLLIAAAARHLPISNSDMHSGIWAQREGTELRGRTLAIAGCGRIGQAIGRIARRGFEMRVVGFRHASGSGDPAPLPDFDLVTSDFNAAVREADFVSLNMATTPETRQFMNRARLAMLKPDAWLINTARGAVVDELALFDALAQGRLGGAALDVFEREPYEPAEPARDLRTLANVIMMPHVGSHTVAANRRMAERALQNIVLGEAGDFAAMDLLNPEVLEANGGHPASGAADTKSGA
jgi:phosphoglycerate dehydrogenase-like enzyme